MITHCAFGACLVHYHNIVYPEYNNYYYNYINNNNNNNHTTRLIAPAAPDHSLRLRRLLESTTLPINISTRERTIRFVDYTHSRNSTSLRLRRLIISYCASSA
jgi:hypothetical protein